MMDSLLKILNEEYEYHSTEARHARLFDDDLAEKIHNAFAQTLERIANRYMAEAIGQETTPASEAAQNISSS